MAGFPKKKKGPKLLWQAFPKKREVQNFCGRLSQKKEGAKTFVASFLKKKKGSKILWELSKKKKALQNFFL